MNPLALAFGALALLVLAIPKKSDAAVRPSDDPPPPDDALPPLGGSWELPESGEPYAMDIATAAVTHGVPERLLARVLWQESRFRPDIINGTVRSSAGAIGIAQFMPATADDLGIDPLDPTQAIDGAARYLRQLYNRFGTWREALAAYNWGQGNVSRRGLANAPRETRNYMRQILTDVYGTEDV